jgi:hypothetical protein
LVFEITKKKVHGAVVGDQTQVTRVTGKNIYHYTTTTHGMA